MLKSQHTGRFFRWNFKPGHYLISTRFTEAPAAEISPLAARLFEVEGVTAVFLGPDFVTVNVAPRRAGLGRGAIVHPPPALRV